jgi:tocopherol O-methyltransferase
MLYEAGLEPLRFEDRSRQVSRTWTVCLQRGLARLADDPQLRRFLLRPGNPERIFALTMLRILAAYGARAMVYGILVAQRPRDGGPAGTARSV